jgi:RHS repeat-associated protein
MADGRDGHTSQGNYTTGWQYDSAGNLTRTTLPDGSYLNDGYDSAHRPTLVTDALGETQGLTYNSGGNITQTLWQTAGSVTKRQHNATFDALGRMSTDIGGQGQTTSYGYDSQSNVTSIESPLLNTASQTFDALNRLKTYTDAATNLSQYSYDAHDRPLTVTDPKGNVTSYVYDGFGDAIQEISPDRGTTIYYYNPDSDLTQKTDASSYVTNMTYDALDRILTRTYPADSTENVAFTYDQTGHGAGIGHLTSVTDQPGSLSLSYDQRGNLITNARTISSNLYSTGYTFESAGRLSSITYASSGWLVSYARDAAGQISAVTAKAPSTAAVNLATSITHLPFGPAASFTYGNGVTDARTYDLDYRMTNVTDTGTSAIQNLTYGYDADNNVHTITDAVTTANNQTLTYDAIDRLSSATGSYGTISSISYDSNSNRKTYGSTSYTIPSTSDRMSAAGGSAISYTSTGNITAIGSTNTMTYNKANQLLTSVASSTTSTYTYDAFGQRLKAVVGLNLPNIFEYENLSGAMLTETNTGTETDYAWLDGMPISAIQPAAASISYIDNSNIGTPQKATNASKAIDWNVNYDPNGKIAVVTNTITQNLRFPGQYNDPTGFYHNGFRDYNPNYAIGGGRYLESDPIGLNGGMNLYDYVGSNPYKFIDPWGLSYETVTTGSATPVYPPSLSGPSSTSNSPVPVIAVPEEPADVTPNRPATTSDSPPAMPANNNSSDEGKMCMSTYGPLSAECMEVKNNCIDKCSDSLPNPRFSYGVPFFNCVTDCMADDGC